MHKIVKDLRGILAAAAVLTAIIAADGRSGVAVPAENKWKVHDMDRPQPSKITPASASTQDRPGRPPSDAIILFDGKDLSAWQALKGGPATWKVEHGYFEVVPKAGDIQTKQAFGDCQLHVEWASPNPPRGDPMNLGNSGVFLMGLYELQIFDSYTGKIYADGQAAGIYGQYPPLVNATLPPGQWQTFDVIFHGPRFGANGTLLRPAFITVLHNDVLAQDHVALMGPTAHMRRPPYQAHPPKLPLTLQEHGNPVRFRNIWIRELSEGNP